MYLILNRFALIKARLARVYGALVRFQHQRGHTRLHRENRGVSHLVEVVVAQTVGKIQVWWISWNRISTGSRIKSYIHDVCVREPRSCSCSLLCTELNLFLPFTIQAHRGRRRKRGGETDPGFVGVNEILGWRRKQV